MSVLVKIAPMRHVKIKLSTGVGKGASATKGAAMVTPLATVFMMPKAVPRYLESK